MQNLITRATPLVSRSLALALVLFVVCGAAPPAHAGRAITVYSAGLDGILVDPTDAGLRTALRMLGSRLRELPAEVDEPEMPAPMLAMVIEMLSSPMTAHLDALDGVDDGGPPFSMQVSVVAGDERAANDQVGSFVQMLSMMGARANRAPNLPGFRMIDLDGVPAFLGTSRQGGRDVFVAGLREVAPEPVGPPPTELPPGVTPGFVMNVDGDGFAMLMDAVAAEMPRDAAAMMRAQMTAYGLAGETPMSLHIALGTDNDRAYGVARATNYTSNEMYQDLLSREPLEARHLDMVPADATAAQIYRLNYAGLADYLRTAATAVGDPSGGAQVDEMMAQIEEVVGVHPEHDVLAHLGTVAGWYTSMSTGGGGLGSAVAFVELSDPAAFNASWSRVTAFANGMAQGGARGYVRIDTREIEGRTVSSLHFPGLPVPLSVSWAVSGNYLYGAVTAQGLLTALDQVERGRPGLGANPRFRAERTPAVASAVNVQFFDAPVLAGKGYGMASLAMEALANAVRSPHDATRDPGLLMPRYDELTDGLRGSLTTYHIEEDDLVVTIRGDRSVTGGFAAAAGAIAGSPTAVAVAALGAGLMLPALGKARANARDFKGMAQLRELGMATMMWAAEHDDAPPPSMDALIDADFIGHDMLRSPHGPSIDDGEDFWLNTTIGRFAEVRHPDRYILAYDRAMYAVGHETINVVFADGHVEAVPQYRFEELVEDPIHAGIDFDLPWH